MTEAIFMDYHSTTPVDPRVLEVVMRAMSRDFGNASSVDHIFGTRAAKIVEESRKAVGDLVGSVSGKIIFTSGATEGLNIVINHIVSNCSKSARIALLPLEHSAVIEACLHHAKQNVAEIVYLTIDKAGCLDLEKLSQLLAEKVDLVCVMGANNEIGTLYPIAEIAAICKAANTPFLCDGSQLAGKTEIRFDDWNLDYLVISAHKIYGPKGVGAVVTKRELLPKPLMFGGSQEYGSRPGTINVPLIAGLAEACRLRKAEMQQDEAVIATRRDRLQQLLLKKIPGLTVNGAQTGRLAGNLHISVPGVPNDAVISRLRNKLAISRGAACSSGIEKPSHVLAAIGLSEAEIEGAFRIGVGKFTTESEIDQAADLLSSAISDVRSFLEVQECQLA
ncbi:MAG: cysteine desulfurase family protein [Candidatus Melainabacteria bacterium]|nr:cysteine desulfurase family protein [Candidatus Melainabacteria bacterium]